MASHSWSDGGAIRGIWASSIQKCFSVSSWNPEEEEKQGDHTFHCGCFEHKALKLNDSFSKSAQYLRRCEEFGLKPDQTSEERPKTIKDNVLKEVQPKEVKILW